MANYIGSKCMICEELFKEDDDIVVCPDCGTPYHRECWKKEDKCINEKLHESGMSWIPEEQKCPHTENDGEPIRCIRCGSENDSSKLFCGECGMPLSQGRNDERPFNGGVQGGEFNNSQNGGTNGFNPYYGQFGQQQFNNQAQKEQNPYRQNPFGMNVQQIRLTEDSDIDGIKLGDLIEYEGRKSRMIVANFIKFAKTGMKTSFNFPALFMPELYFFYRKMNKKGVFFLIAAFILSIPSLLYYGQEGTMGMVLFDTSINFESTAVIALTNFTALISTVLNVVAGLYANYWYYQQARQEITKLRQTDMDAALSEEEIKQKLHKSGGTSWAGVIVAFTASVLLALAFWLTLSIIF